MINWERMIALSVSDRKAPVEKALKCAEETGELAQAVLSVSDAHACAYKGYEKDDVVKEAADVVQCAISVVAKLYEKEGFPREKFEAVFEEKLERWEAKQKAE